MENDLKQIKLENIKNVIDYQLHKLGFYEKIKKFVDENFIENENFNLNDEERVMNKIKEAGLVDEIVSNLIEPEPETSNNLPAEKVPDITSRCLFLKLISGKGFVDYIKPHRVDNSNNLNLQTNSEEIVHEIDILFFGQRFQSKKFFPSSSEFQIQDSFVLNFNPLKLDLEINFNLLKKISSPIHLVLIEINKITNGRKLIATKSLEWRWTLCYGKWKIDAEMYSPSTMNKLNVGSLELELSILPAPNLKLDLIPEQIIFEQLNEEKREETEKTQDFIQYANDWWDDYKTIRASHSTRLIKLFLPTEDRENYVYKPANSLIEPISIGRALGTPYEAARFVSLIPFERRENPGGEKVELWQSTHTFLSVLKGDVEDHSILLCNLLLGFGLDAYIAIGFSINGPHVWVITRSKLDKKELSGNKGSVSVIFWESLTGQRVQVEDPKVFRFYKRLHCCFNDKTFYANIQIDDSVFNTNYNFEDEFLWKSIPNDKINGIVKYSFTPILDVLPFDKFKVEQDIEREIKSKITKFRKALELKSGFDGKLSHLLSPALVNYEFERMSNLTYGNEEFKQSVKNYVPEGFTFKGYPLHTTGLDCDNIFGSILSNEIGKDILHTRGDQVTFAVRCKIYLYPQNVFSVWFMIATKYRQIR